MRKNEHRFCNLIFLKLFSKKALTSKDPCVIIYGLGKRLVPQRCENKNTEE